MTRNRLPAALVWRSTATRAIAGWLPERSGQRPMWAPARARARATLDLAAVCPATVVVQTAWTPEAEHGALYHLLGQTYTVDAGSQEGLRAACRGGQGHRRHHRDPGRRSGDRLPERRRADVRRPDHHARQVATDDAIGLSAKQPVIGVVAPFDIAPYMIMWDPAANLGFNSIVDIGKTDTHGPLLQRRHLYGATSPAPASSSEPGRRLLRRQPDPFLAGRARWRSRASPPTSRSSTRRSCRWKKPVKFQLIHDTGYPIYPEAIVVRGGQEGRARGLPEEARAAHPAVPDRLRQEPVRHQRPASSS